jgi:hypothetical protein
MELTRRANGRTDRAEDIRRARLLLLPSEGHTWEEVFERIESDGGFVASWNERFLEQRIAGLYGWHIGRVASALTPELEAQILQATRRPPGDSSTHWCSAQAQRSRGRQQHDVGSRLPQTRIEAAVSDRAIPGVERSGLREEGGRHHWAVFESASACGGVLCG